MPSFIKHLRLALIEGLGDVGKETTQRIQEGFSRGQNALGQSWAPLAPATIQQKGNDDILVDTGTLKNSYQHELNEGSLNLEIYTEVPYAVFHEFGTERMPARPVLIPAAIHAEQNILPDAFDSAIDKAQRRSGAGRSISTYI